MSIPYLVVPDFGDGYNINSSLQRKPIFAMIQADFCSHCRHAKPAFEQLANEGIVDCMYIQGDGKTPAERDLVHIIPKIYPNFQGYPSYMLFINGKKIPYTGGRDLKSMKSFLSRYL